VATLQDAVREARREHILDAARAEFAQKGLGGASMRGIALRAGCTTGAIYPLFATKEGLYAALLGESLARLRTAIADAAAPARTPAGALERAAMAFVAYYEARPFELNLGLHAFEGLRRSGLGPDHDRELNASLERTLDVLGRPLAACLGIEPAQARRHTLLLFSQTMGALVLHAAGRLAGSGTTPAALVRMQLDLMLGRASGHRRHERRFPR
jgi:AcrR family transcriptional regulator